MNESLRIIQELHDRGQHIGYTDVLESQTHLALTEASLGRAYQHFLTVRAGDRKVQSFSILTYWSTRLRSVQPKVPGGSWDHSRNLELRRPFEQELARVSRGFFKMRGYGQEEDPDAPGSFTVSEEPSYWANGIALADAVSLSRKYGQDAFTYAGPETGGDVVMFNQRGKEIQRWTKFDPRQIGQFYSKIKGRPFTFEIRDDGIDAMQLRYHVRGLQERIRTPEFWLA